MKTFLVVEEQAGQGCDYTICCGVLSYTLEAESLEAALAQLKNAALSDGDLSDEEGGGLLDTEERRRSRAHLYEIAASVEIPLKTWRAELKAAAEAEHAAAKEREEREQLAKLQKKYGTK